MDVRYADAVMIMGSNMAECHPVSFRFVMQAKERGAKVIHIDPRFTRTSAMADIYAPLRAGTDIAFLGGLIRHVLEEEKYFKEYVVSYTNAATLINEKYQDTEDLEGLFSRLRGGKTGIQLSDLELRRAEPGREVESAENGAR